MTNEKDSQTATAQLAPLERLERWLREDPEYRSVAKMMCGGDLCGVLLRQSCDSRNDERLHSRIGRTLDAALTAALDSAGAAK